MLFIQLRNFEAHFFFPVLVAMKVFELPKDGGQLLKREALLHSSFS